MMVIDFEVDLSSEERDEVERFIVDNGLGGEEFVVVDDSKRDELVREEIENSAWAFNAWFILEHSSVDMTTEQLKRIQEDQSEDANDLVLRLIDDFDEFVESAVSADGYGHFLNRYDGEEHEILLNDKWYFIYATS